MSAITPNHIRVKNMENNSLIYIELDKFDFMKNLLSEDSVCEHVYISPDKIVFRTELFQLCQ